jgi:NADH-quinone oxidoreductase subunit C
MSDSQRMTRAQRRDVLAENLVAAFAEWGCELLQGFGELTLVVPEGRLVEVALALRDRLELRFEQLMDLCGVDYGTFGQSEWVTEEATSSGFGRAVDRNGVQVEESRQRFGVVYHLLSLEHNQRLRLRVYATGSPPAVASVCGVWICADWFEREAFDLFGILFHNHPDLRRLLTDYGFVGHPFRKDFPLSGHVEMRYDPERQRVVYEPAQIEPRTLVPRVIRDDNRLLQREHRQHRHLRQLYRG